MTENAKGWISSGVLTGLNRMLRAAQQKAREGELSSEEETRNEGFIAGVQYALEMISEATFETSYLGNETEPK